MNPDSDLSKLRSHSELLLNQGRYAEALDLFRKRAALEPHDPNVLHNLAVCLWQKTDGSKDALVQIEQAISLNPHDGEHFALKSLILADLERLEEALAAAGEAFALEPGLHLAFMARNAALAQLKKWKELEASAREGLSFHADSTTLANSLSLALRMQGRAEEASEQALATLAQDPESAMSHTHAGWACLQQGQPAQAEDHFLEALRIRPGTDYAREGLLEAFRTRSRLYRLYFNYTQFMQRFTSGRQWMFIIGLLVGVKVLRALAETISAGLALLVISLYFLFVLWAHVARPVGNLLILFDRRVRRILDTEEKLSGALAGGSLVLGVVLLITGWTVRQPACSTLGMVLVGLSIPLGYFFTNPSFWGRMVFGTISAAVLVGGSLAATHHISAIPVGDAASDTGGTVAILAVIATTWLANVSSLRSA